MHGVAINLFLTHPPLQHQQGFGRFKKPIPLQQRKIQRRCSQTSYQNVRATLDLKPPPYPLNALEPHMSRRTLEFHWGKHHRGYVENLNRQTVGTELDGMPLEEIVVASYNKGDLLPTFNNAAQTWNHDFFWQSMKPSGGGQPSGDLLELIERDFGSYEAFLSEFKSAAATQFGSGWAWLVYKANKLDVGNAVNPYPSEKDNKLVVVKTPNAINPLVWDYTEEGLGRRRLPGVILPIQRSSDRGDCYLYILFEPLLTIDVWEHAYYLDYQNRRPDFISIFLEKLVSWESVSSRLDKAKARAAERAKEDERRRHEDEEDLEDSEIVEMYLDSEGDESEVE